MEYLKEVKTDDLLIQVYIHSKGYAVRLIYQDSGYVLPMINVFPTETQAYTFADKCAL